MSDDSTNLAPLYRIIVGAVFTALLSIGVVTYQDVSGIKQFMLDHLISHDLESENCEDYRANMRRELDLIWHKINQIDLHNHEG